MTQQDTKNKPVARCFALLCLYLTPVFDILNGIFANSGLLSIGQATHTVMIIGNIFFILLLGYRKPVCATLFSSLYFLFFVLVQALLSNGLSLNTDLNYSSKLLLFLTEWLFLKSCVDGKIISEKDFVSFLKYSMALIPLSILFAKITGTMKLSYGGEVGTKGYFTSLNALTIILITLVILAVHFAIYNKSSWLWAVFNIVAVFLLGSKSPFIFLAAALVLAVLFNSKNRLKMIAFLTIIAVGCYIVVHFFFSNEFTKIIQWQTSFMDRAAQTDNWTQYLLSGRNQLLTAGWTVFLGHLPPIAFLFGIGPYTLQSGIGSILNLSSLRGVEMDFAEIFFAYGAVIALPLYYIILKAFTWKAKDQKTAFCDNLCLGGMLIFSIFGGHVLTEAISATYLAMLLAFKYCRQRSLCLTEECSRNDSACSKYFKAV